MRHSTYKGLYPDEIAWLAGNWAKVSHAEALAHINGARHPSERIGMTTLRDRCGSLGLNGAKAPPWHPADEARLRAWLPLMGNKELAAHLSSIGGRPDGHRQSFTAKSVLKKMGLLGLSRTQAQKDRIRGDHDLLGVYREAMAKTRAAVGVAGEGATGISRRGSLSYRTVKVGGRWVSHARHVFEREVRPLRPGEAVFHLDMDPLNDDPPNLEARRGPPAHADRRRALPLLEARIAALQGRWAEGLTRGEKGEAMEEMVRLQKIAGRIRARLEKAGAR